MYLLTNLKAIMDDIKNYKPDPKTSDFYEEDQNGLRNGYANVLTDLVMTTYRNNQELLKAYVKNITPANKIFLGADKETQHKNLDKIMASDAFKKLPEDQKQTIFNTFLDINNMDKVTLGEKMKNSFDSIVKQFG